VARRRDSDIETGPERGDVEAGIRVHVEAGDIELAVTRAVEHYGPELYGFLRAIGRDDDLASDAFAVASEQLWRNLASFRWESSLRTWWYYVARNTLYRLRRDPDRRPERNVPLSIAGSVAAVHRTATARYQRTEAKDTLRALRESLEPLDHEILILRLDRAMSWKDIARALATDEDTDTIDQRAAAYRKRFERAKQRLRELAVVHGLLADE
jgi:RNA polymerase sigma-70 factor (ECF subfamily)